MIKNIVKVSFVRFCEVWFDIGSSVLFAGILDTGTVSISQRMTRLMTADEYFQNKHTGCSSTSSFTRSGERSARRSKTYFHHLDGSLSSATLHEKLAIVPVSAWEDERVRNWEIIFLTEKAVMVGEKRRERKSIIK